MKTDRGKRGITGFYICKQGIRGKKDAPAERRQREGCEERIKESKRELR